MKKKLRYRDNYQRGKGVGAWVRRKRVNNMMMNRNYLIM